MASTMSLRGGDASSASSRFNETVCVFTILFGGFDKLLPPPRHLLSPNVEFYVMTDQPGAGHPPPWQEHVVSPLPYDEARQNARAFKMLPPDELWNKCDIALQIDANIDFLRSPLELAQELQPHANLGLIRHPFLSDYQSEIDHLCQIYPHDCALYESHSKQHLHSFDGRQAHQYETSVMIRRQNDQTKNLMQAWRDDLFASGHLRDQVALVPVLHARNSDIELYGPGGKLRIKPSSINNRNADGESDDDPVVYTKHLQHGKGPPSFIQVYKGHNHDFAKWRCHGKVMGKHRSAFAHSAYCSVYYITKRYAPWIETLVPVTYNTIKAMDLKDPFNATIVSLLFVVFALAVYFPRSSLMLRLRGIWVAHMARWRQSFLVRRLNDVFRNDAVGKLILLAVRLAIVIGVGFCVTCSYFYTVTMGVACLWPSIPFLAPPIFVILMARHLYLGLIRKSQRQRV